MLVANVLIFSPVQLNSRTTGVLISHMPLSKMDRVSQAQAVAINNQKHCKADHMHNFTYYPSVAHIRSICRKGQLQTAVSMTT